MGWGSARRADWITLSWDGLRETSQIFQKYHGTPQLLPWYTSPRCGILIRTALKTTLKLAEFSKRTWRLKKVRSCNWHPHSRSIRSVDKSRRIKLCRGPRTPGKNAGKKSREPKEPSRRDIVEQVVVKKLLWKIFNSPLKIRQRARLALNKVLSTFPNTTKWTYNRSSFFEIVL